MFVLHGKKICGADMQRSIEPNWIAGESFIQNDRMYMKTKNMLPTNSRQNKEVQENNKMP
jgi:hypothetical protein